MTAAKPAPGPGSPIGVVGLGNMGAPMARNLSAAGFGVVAFDRVAAAVDGLVADTSVQAATCLADLAGRCHAVITMLPRGEDVRDVVLGAPEGHGDRLLAGLAPGSVVLDMSSSPPRATQDLGSRLAAKDIAIVDAPVSGGVPRAIDATLAIMVGGDDAVVDRVLPLLEAMGRDILRTGPLGSGHAMKALNNYVSAAGLVAAAEALIVGRRFGLEPETMVRVLNASSGRNNSTEKKLSQQVISRRFAAGFSLGLMVKDINTALDLAQDCDLHLGLAETCVDLWRRAEALLGADVDHTAVVRLLESETGEEIAPLAR